LPEAAAINKPIFEMNDMEAVAEFSNLGKELLIQLGLAKK
jgi:hypothetical protein